MEDFPITTTTVPAKIQSVPRKREPRSFGTKRKLAVVKKQAPRCTKKRRSKLLKQGLPAVLRYLRGRRYVTSMRAPKDKKRRKVMPTRSNVLQLILKERLEFLHREAAKALTCDSAYSDTTIIRYAREIVRFGGGADFQDMFKLTPLSAQTLIGCMVEMIRKANKRELGNRDVHTFFRGSHLTSVVWRDWLAPLTESIPRFPLSLSISDQVKLLPLLEKHL